MDFKALKAMSGKDGLSALTAELEKLTTKSERKVDERFWQPTVDKMGNGYAVIRFLPPPKNETTSFVKYWDHGFQGPSGSWYIENSRTSLGKDEKDPATEMTSRLWKSGNEADQEIARKRKRRLHFVSNIFVLQDPAKKENEGKVFMFKYGKKIFDKINEAGFPPFDEMGRTPETPGYDPTNAFNPFDFWTGANFALKIRKVEGYRNYDQSVFLTPGPLFKDDKKLEAIYNQEYSLKEILDPSNFKTYAELKAKLDRVLAEPMEGTTDNVMRQMDQREASPIKERHSSSIPEAAADDDDMAYFEKLASGQD